MLKHRTSIAQAAHLVKRCTAWIAAHELVLLAAAAPFLLFPGRWVMAGLALIGLTWLCRWLACGQLVRPTALDLPIALLVFMAAVGTGVSVDPAMSRAKMWGLVLQAATFFAMARSLRHVRGLRTAAAAVVAGTAVVALLSLVGTDWGAVRLWDLPGLYGRLPRLSLGLPGSGVPRASTLFHPREVAGTLAMLLPVPVALLLSGQERRLRLPSALALAAGGAVLLLTQSLQALLGLGLALLLIAAWRSRWALLSLPLGLLGAGGLLWVYGPRRAALALLSPDHPLGIGVLLRLDMWSRAWAMIRDMPYTGVGLNTFPLIQTHFYPGVLLGPEPHAHNLYLQTAVDLGLPGLLAFLWLAVAFFLTAARACRATAEGDLRALLVGLAAGFVAYLGNGLLDAVTLGAKPVVALFAMLGLAAAIGHVGRQGTLGEGEPKPQRRRPARRAWLAALLLGLLALGLLASPALAALNLGALRAHQLLFQARQAGALPAAGQSAALGLLERAARREPAAVSTHELLGSLYAWQGQDEAALAALEQVVALDGAGSIARYAPWLPWRRRLLDAPSPGTWQDLAEVYRQWTARYPERAETCVRLALIYDRHLGQAAQARVVLRAGQQVGAVPAGLLASYLSQLQ